jgi:hypothetical protein
MIFLLLLVDSIKYHGRTQFLTISYTKIIDLLRRDVTLDEERKPHPFLAEKLSATGVVFL